MRFSLSLLFASLLGASALAGGCTGLIGDGGPPPHEGPPAGFEPAEATIYRLTASQLGASYRALLGEPLTLPEDLPADDQMYGFTSISAASRTISPLDAEQYETAAYQVLDQVFADPARLEALVGCAPTDVSSACVQSFVEDFTMHAWRRPLADGELDTLTSLALSLGQDLQSPRDGLRYALAAVLQSPHFLFRVEHGRLDEPSGLLRYTSWEMASRLSFLITDGPPDEQLFAAAAAGELDDVEAVRAHAERLLELPEARSSLVRFFRDFMSIGRLDQLDKSSELFPMFSATLGPAMRTEIERLFEDQVFERGGDFRQLFTTRDTYVNDELAALYGLDPVGSSELVAVTLPDDSRRAGLLTTPGFLAMNAHKTATSPTHRGRFVRISLLCQDVPPPPPGVDTSLDDTTGGANLTLRQRLEEHRNNPQCASCHDKMDPIGFGLENFDAIGQWRDSDNGSPVDAKTQLDGAPFEGGVELGEIVATLPEVGSCIARRFYQHATGHLDDRGERLAVDALIEKFVAGDYDFKQLVVSLVVNDGYRYALPIDDAATEAP